MSDNFKKKWITPQIFLLDSENGVNAKRFNSVKEATGHVKATLNGFFGPWFVTQNEKVGRKAPKSSFLS